MRQERFFLSDSVPKTSAGCTLPAHEQVLQAIHEQFLIDILPVHFPVIFRKTLPFILIEYFYENFI